MIDDVGYDAELEDARILVDRHTTEAFFSTQDLAAYFGRVGRTGEQWVYRQRQKGHIPAPAEPPMPLQGVPCRWSRRQLIEIVAGMIERGEPVPE